MFSKLRVPLVLYVPPSSVDATRRLCTELQIPVAEIWTFHLQFDQARFTMVYRAPDAAIPKTKPAPSAKSVKPKPAPKSKAAKARPAAKRKAAVKAKPKAGAKKSVKAGKRR